MACFHLLTPQFSLEQQKLPSSVVVTLSRSLKTSYTVWLAILDDDWLFWVQVVLNVVTEPPTTSWYKLRLWLVSRLHRIVRWWYLCPDGVGANISCRSPVAGLRPVHRPGSTCQGGGGDTWVWAFFMFLLSSYIHQIIFEKNFGYFR